MSDPFHSDRGMPPDNTMRALALVCCLLVSFAAGHFDDIVLRTLAMMMWIVSFFFARDTDQ